MAGTAYVLPKRGASNDELWRAIYQIVADANGSTSWQRSKNYTGVEDDDDYVVTVENQGTGGHINVPSIFQVEDSGVTISALTISGDLAVGDDLTVGDDVGITGDALIGGTLGVTGATNLTALTATGAVALGDANADTITLIGAVTIRSTTPTTLALFDVANQRAIIGSGTALTSATDDKLSVVGGALHIASTTGATPALVQGWRFGAAGTTYGLWIDTATNPELIWKDDGGVETIRFSDSSDTNQLTVTGGALITGALTAQGTVSFDGNVSLGNAGTDTITVVGALVAQNDVTLGNAAGDTITITGTATFAQNTTFSGGISTGASSAFSGGISVAGGYAQSTGDFTLPNTNLGFFGAAANSKQTVTGSRGGNAALQSLLSALANYGLITDSSS